MVVKAIAVEVHMVIIMILLKQLTSNLGRVGSDVGHMIDTCSSWAELDVGSCCHFSDFKRGYKASWLVANSCSN